MKIHFILLMTFILAVSTAGAQHSKFNIGIKGGLNMYNVYNDNNYAYDYKPGFHAGLLAHIHLAKHFALQPEVVFSRQGAMYDFPASNTRLNLDYVNVPVLFQFMFGHGFRLEAGPQVGFLAAARSVNDNYSYNQINNMKMADVGAAVGMSYVSLIGLGIDARYVHGLTNINNSGTVYSANRGFQLGLFYLFKHRP